MDISRLKPKDATAAAIAAAQREADLAVDSVAVDLRTAKAERDRLLIDGTPAELAKAERALAAVKDVAERVHAVRDQLAHRHAAAIKAEGLARVEAARLETERANRRLETWWDENRLPVFAQLAEGLALLNQASDTCNDWMREARAASEHQGGADFAHPAPVVGDADQWPELLGVAARMRDFSISVPMPPLAAE